MLTAWEEVIRTLNSALPIVPINYLGPVSFTINTISTVPVVVPPPSAARAGSQVANKSVSPNPGVFDLSSSTLCILHFPYRLYLLIKDTCRQER